MKVWMNKEMDTLDGCGWKNQSMDPQQLPDVF